MSQITDTTREAILDAAWELTAKRGHLKFSQAEIARRAGVSRQTVNLAFGARAGLLLAMVRNKDRKTAHVSRLREIATGAGDKGEDLMQFLDIWLDYLPIIYPVGIELDAASLSDPDAAAAWNSRIKTGLLDGLKMILSRISRSGGLANSWTAEDAAVWIWSLVHPVQWRLLVVEHGCPQRISLPGSWPLQNPSWRGNDAYNAATAFPCRAFDDEAGRISRANRQQDRPAVSQGAHELFVNRIRNQRMFLKLATLDHYRHGRPRFKGNRKSQKRPLSKLLQSLVPSDRTTEHGSFTGASGCGAQ